MGTRLDVGVIALGAELERWHPDYLASTAGTDFTELNPRPGTPTTTDNYPRLQPQIVGAQSQDVELLVMEAGFPKQGGTGLQVGYYLSGESESVARGYQAPLFFVDKVMAVSTTGSQATAAACPLCGRIVVASGSNAARNVTVFNPHTNGYTTPTSPTVISAAALTFVPGTERLLWIASTACYYSDDHGTTWTEYDDEGPSSVMTSFTVTSLYVGQDVYRAAFDGAGNLLYAAYNENGTASIDLAASSDQGASWSLVESIAEVTALRFDMCAMADGAIAFVYNDSGTDNKVRFKRLGGAFEAPSGVDAVEVTAAIGAGVGAIGIACDENGALWCYVSELTASTITRIYFSVDAGTTWTRSFDLVTLSGGGYEIVQFALVPHPYGGLGGHMCSLGGFVRLGGWSGPGRDSGNWTDQTAPRADMHWFGTDDPANFGMTKTGASTDAIVNSGGTSPHGYWRVQSGAGAAQGYWQRTVHSANRSEAAAEWLCRITDDGGTTSSAPSASGIGVRLQSADGGANQRRTIIVYMDEGGYRVWDEEAAAWIGSKVSVTLTTRTFFRVSFTSTAIHVMHRQDSTSKTKWTLTTLAAPSTAATAASGVIARWGHLTGVANTESHWWIVYARGVSASPMEGTSNDGVGLGPYSYPLPDLHDSTAERLSRLTLRGGPAFTGDTYTVTADHDYPVEALFPQAEPNMERVWQSAASPTTETILCSLHDSQDTLPNSTSIVLAVRNCNVRQISLMAQTKAGASTSMATLDLATGFTSIAWIRSGNVVAPNAAYTSGRFIGAGELRGGHFYDAGSGLAREIEDNTAGFWSTAASVKATIFLKGDPSSLGASGTGGFIAWPAGVLILHMSPTVTKRGNWGIRIATQPFDSTQDTGYRCKASLLAARVPGKGFDRGAEWSLRPNVRSEADERGTDRRERKGPMRRMLTIPWDHGADMQGFRGTRGDATEYVGPDGSGGPALAVRDDVWQQLTGLYTASGDGARLVCAILKTAPDWNSGTSQSTETITDPTAYILGYLDADLRATINRGAYGTEFVMPGPLRIVEAV